VIEAAPGMAAHRKTPVPAGFVLRLVAWFIDLFVTACISLGIALIVRAGMWMVGRFGVVTVELSLAASFLSPLLGLLASWLYFAGLESSPKQATLGKQMLGLIVTDGSGGRVGFGRASVRFWSKLVSMALFMVGFVMAAFTERKQALHDLIADCLVVKR
jgi:uncharacterized RDD family membrane protein YckC